MRVAVAVAVLALVAQVAQAVVGLQIRVLREPQILAVVLAEINHKQAALES